MDARQSADYDIVIGVGKAGAGFAAYGDVSATGAISECSATEGVVVETSYVFPKRGGTDGGVAVTRSVI